MTEIDSAAFEAAVAPCNFTAGRIDDDGTSEPAHFNAALGRIYVTAQAILLSARPPAGHTQPGLTVVVEDSADGSSWATVATFDFTASDQQSAAVDSPRAYLRASWAGVVGTWAVDVAVKSIASPASGGGSQPSVTDGYGTTIPDVSTLRVPGKLANLGGGEAAIGVVAELLGPFRVNWDDANITTTGVDLADLAEGTVVLTSFVITNDFAGSASTIGLAVGLGVVGFTSYLANFDCYDEYNGPTDPVWIGSVPPSGGHAPLPGIVNAAGQKLRASISLGGGNITAGYADVYAVALIPA